MCKRFDVRWGGGVVRSQNGNLKRGEIPARAPDGRLRRSAEDVPSAAKNETAALASSPKSLAPPRAWNFNRGFTVREHSLRTRSPLRRTPLAAKRAKPLWCNAVYGYGVHVSAQRFHARFAPEGCADRRRAGHWFGAPHRPTQARGTCIALAYCARWGSVMRAKSRSQCPRYSRSSGELSSRAGPERVTATPAPAPAGIHSIANGTIAPLSVVAAPP
jgi:hypothetical protein